MKILNKEGKILVFWRYVVSYSIIDLQPGSQDLSTLFPAVKEKIQS